MKFEMRLQIVGGVFVLLLVSRYLISPVLRIDLIDMKDVNVIVTGACGGIGLSTLTSFFQMNATVVASCRNQSTAEFTCNQLIMGRFATTGVYSPTCIPIELQLESFESVRRFVSKIGEYDELSHIDILINNAGVRQSDLSVTEDGIERHYQVNHLSHFLLTILLMPLLCASTWTLGPRVVHVSSSAHAFGYIDRNLYNSFSRNTNITLFDDAQAKRLEGVYGDTKLMQLLFSLELQRRIDNNIPLQPDNTSLCLSPEADTPPPSSSTMSSKVLSVVVHPGLVKSNMGHSDKRLLQWFVLLTRQLVGRSTEQGAVNTLFASITPAERVRQMFTAMSSSSSSSSSQARGPIYINNAAVSASAAAASNVDDAMWLWEMSEVLVGLSEHTCQDTKKKIDH